MGSFCLSTVPMMEAIASTDKRLIAKRMDESSSTLLASARRSVFSCMPAVLVFICRYSFPFVCIHAKYCCGKQKGVASATPVIWFLLFCLLLQAGNVI